MRAFEALASLEQKRQLEELHRLTAAIDRLNQDWETVPRPKGKRMIQRQIGALKRERTERARGLVRDGVSPERVAPAADFTTAYVRQLGRSG